MSGLWFHDRDTIGATVPSEQYALLARVFGDGAEQPPQHDAERAIAFVQALRASRRWLACGCRKDSHALISPRLLADGRATLVRHGRNDHGPTCPFQRTRVIHITRTRADRREDLIGTPHRGLFALLDVDASRASRRAAVRRRPTRPSAPPSKRRLHRLLTSALSNAGYDAIRAEDLIDLRRGSKLDVGHADVRAHYRQIDRVRTWPVAEGITLGDIWCNQIAGIEPMLERAKALRWPARAVPHGAFIGPVDSLAGGELVWTRRDGKRVAVPIHAGNSGNKSSSSGPHWAIAVAGDSGEENWEVLCAHTVPVYSRALLLPVADDAARHVARVLLRQLRYWLTRHGLAVTLHRPLFTEEIPASVDFHLSSVGAAPVAIIVRRAGVAVPRAEMMRAAQFADLVVADPSDEPLHLARQLTAAVLRAAGHPRE